MANWIKTTSGSLLNVDNILGLKVHKTNCAVQAECVGNITRDLCICDTREEAHARMLEIAGMEPEEKPEPKKPAAKRTSKK